MVSDHRHYILCSKWDSGVLYDCLHLPEFHGANVLGAQCVVCTSADCMFLEAVVEAFAVNLLVSYYALKSAGALELSILE